MQHQQEMFWDLIRIRYWLELTRIAENCECGTEFTIKHALSCKRGGFVSLRHNQIPRNTASLLNEVCHVCVVFLYFYFILFVILFLCPNELPLGSLSPVISVLFILPLKSLLTNMQMCHEGCRGDGG